MKNTSRYSRLILWLLGARISIDKSKIPTERNCFVVSNHLSYLDILVISSRYPCLFITSKEVQKTPFIGYIATLGGSFFVERRNPSGLHKELDSITRTIDNNFPIALFPEGTTSHGESLLPFKSSLFEAPCRRNIDILPIILRYKKLNGVEITEMNREHVYYVGTVSIFKHMFRLPFCDSIEISMEFLPKVDSSQYENRKALSAALREAMLKVYHNEKERK